MRDDIDTKLHFSRKMIGQTVWFILNIDNAHEAYKGTVEDVPQWDIFKVRRGENVWTLSIHDIRSI